MAAGEFICVGGTDSKAILCTSDGTVLATLASRSSWVWCVRAHPKKNCIAVGSEDGSIAVYQLLFSTVHSLYHDRYAYRYIRQQHTVLVVLWHFAWTQVRLLLLQLCAQPCCRYAAIYTACHMGDHKVLLSINTCKSIMCSAKPQCRPSL